uniref:Uncharacterized protein n=1 Tax=Catharus ustulatus TaxID=91951 RepID=A0A8C3YB91_CATUS
MGAAVVLSYGHYPPTSFRQSPANSGPLSHGRTGRALSHHTFGGGGGLCALEGISGNKEFREGGSGAGRGAPPSEEILCTDLSTFLAASPHRLLSGHWSLSSVRARLCSCSDVELV